MEILGKLPRYITLFALLISANSFAYHGYGYKGSYYRGNYGTLYNGYGNYNRGGWYSPNIIVTSPILYDDYYSPPYYPYNTCPIVQQCYSNGDCLQVQQC